MRSDVRAVLAVALFALLGWPEAGRGATTIEVFPTPGLEARSAALIMSGQSGGDLPISVLALPRTEDAEGASVPVDLIVEVSGRELPAASDGPLFLEFHTYLLAEEGGIVSAATHAIDLSDAAIRSSLASSGVRYRGHLVAAFGHYSLRVLVHSRQIDRFGVRALPLDLTPEALARPRLFAEDPASSWVDAPAPGEAVRGGIQTRPVTVPGGRLRLSTTGGADGADSWSARFENDRDPVREGAVHSTTPAPGRTLHHEVTVPNLLPGRYRVTLSNGAESTTPLTLFVAPPGESPPTTWADLPDSLDEAATAALKEAAARRGSGRGRMQRDVGLARDYAEALRLFATEDETAGLEAVREFERASLAAKQRPPTAQCEWAELWLGQKIAAQRADALIPVMVLHEELYRDYYGKRDFLLATHSRNVTLQLLDWFLDGETTGNAPRIGADLLVSFAGYFYSLGSAGSARQLLERALDIDPHHPGALLGQAVLLERIGDYRNASRHLEDLLDLEPDHAEARLRLAMHQWRSGRRKAADSSLSEIGSDPSAPPWVRVLAAQERARLLSGSKRISEAVDVLRQATRETPAPTLWIQLSALLDRSGDLEDASEALRRYRESPPSEGASPRLRYTQWSEESIRSARAALARAAEEQRPLLASTLAGLAGGA